MGYRHRFARVSREIVDTVRNMAPEELKSWLAKNHPEGWCEECGEDGYFVHYELLGQEEFFDFGKDCEFAGDLLKKGNFLFSNPDTKSAMEDILLCTREDFEFAIESYRAHIHNYFKNAFENYSHAEMLKYFDEKADTWCNLTELLHMQDLTPEKAEAINLQHRPYDMSRTSDTLVSSWLYEYQIFELVRIYKSFDFDKYCILFYGW